MVLGNSVVVCPVPVQFHLHLLDLFFCESCVAYQLRDVLVSSSDPVVQCSVSFKSVIFFCLDYLGQDFEVVIVALVGDLQGNDFRITFRCFGDLLVDQTRELAGLDADNVKASVEELHSSFGILGDPVVGFV